MLPRAAPRPRAGACTLESSLRCLRTSDHLVLRGVLQIQENRPPPDYSESGMLVCLSDVVCVHATLHTRWCVCYFAHWIGSV